MNSPVRSVLKFSRLLTGNVKFYGWDIFDVPIATTGYTKELLAHYCETTLSDIKSQAETINSTNDRRDQEGDQIYT